MRIFGSVILCLVTLACDSKAGRYKQINNPRYEHASAVCPDPGRDPDCGLTILDSSTGTIFIRQSGQWREENPHTGHFEEHSLSK
jgi:hypothetical protein